MLGNVFQQLGELCLVVDCHSRFPSWSRNAVAFCILRSSFVPFRHGFPVRHPFATALAATIRGLWFCVVHEETGTSAHSVPLQGYRFLLVPCSAVTPSKSAAVSSRIRERDLARCWSRQPARYHAAAGDVQQSVTVNAGIRSSSETDSWQTVSTVIIAILSKICAAHGRIFQIAHSINTRIVLTH